jgi:hypothetical protein
MGLESDEEVAIDQEVSYSKFMYTLMNDNEKATL